MLGLLHRWILLQPRKIKTIVCAVLALIIGICDHFTGFELSFSIFYVAPISLASWYIDRSFGFLMAVFSACIWLLTDWTSGHEYSYQYILIWNTLTRLFFFLIISNLITLIRTHLNIEMEMARTDSLTSILNRRAFHESMQQVFELADRYGHSTSMAVIDIDNFKQINDQKGHGEGDRLLVCFAQILKDTFRETDLIGRMGGDEFAVVLPQTDISGARNLFQRFEDNMKCAKSKHLNLFTVSVGVGVFGRVPSSFDQAFTFVDELMYRVKKAGKKEILIEEYREE